MSLTIKFILGIRTGFTKQLKIKVVCIVKLKMRAYNVTNLTFILSHFSEHLHDSLERDYP